MKNLEITLSALAILTMAGTTFATAIVSYEPAPGFFISVEPTPGFDVQGLDSYLVSIEGSRGFENIKINGQVHQMNSFFFDDPIASPFLQIYPPGFEIYEQVDTHFMFDKSAGLFIKYQYLDGIETNDKSNPAQLTPFYGFKFGIGSFDTTGRAFYLFGDLSEKYDFMRVVVPAGGEVQLAGTARVNDQNVEFLVPIPEPCTAATLIAASLCLMGFRFTQSNSTAIPLRKSNTSNKEKS